MEEIRISLFGILVALEIFLVLLAVAVLLWVRTRRLGQRLREAPAAEAGPVPAQKVSLEQYLRDEIIRNQAFLDQQTTGDVTLSDEQKQLLQLRKQFLELELSARAAQSNPVEFTRLLTGGLGEIADTLRPAAPADEPPPAAESSGAEAEEEAASEAEALREMRDTHEEEVDHLRSVINNQQDAMAALRKKLQDSEHELEGVEDIMAKLDEFERQSAELHQALQTLEAENERLKQAKKAEGSKTEAMERDPAQLKGLKSMVGKQQETIDTLQNLVRELAPEAGKARELQDAIAQIERTNGELTGCVAVLEDENKMLREELEEIQAYLDAQEQAQAQAAEAQEAAALSEDRAQNAEETMEEMQIKVQELEALVEFKDAAIEELEKQYNALQAKYLAETGKKSLD